MKYALLIAAVVLWVASFALHGSLSLLAGALALGLSAFLFVKAYMKTIEKNARYIPPAPQDLKIDD